MKVNSTGLSTDFEHCNNRVKSVRPTVWATTSHMQSSELDKETSPNSVSLT